jgi:pimeloyl-ACP methyl ester carboxylesterase
MPAFCSAEVVTLFSHGIADTWKQVRLYSKFYIKKSGVRIDNNRYAINTTYASFNYPDATDKFYRVNYHETSFGQANEIGRLHKAYQQTKERFKDCDIILYGLSRGASNVCIFAGTYPIDKVKAIVLESPYFTMGEVIQSLMNKKNLSWMPLSYGETVAEFIFKKYTRYGQSPATLVEFIPKDMPIFIICSKEDRLVPYESSINVYKKLIKTGHKHTYIFITEHGKHAAILQGADGDKYECVINAFYEKYNLPYSPSKAEQGRSLLADCQPQFD